MPNRKKPTVVDLFAGVGGISLGFEKAGFDIVLAIDNDTDCSKTFLYNHKFAKYLIKSIENIKKRDIEHAINDKKIDVIVGGPPCQGFSVSGKRNEDDPRNMLYKHYFRIVKILKPKAIVIENVPGLQHMYDGKVFSNVCKKIALLGYIPTCKILSADQYGIPQKRKRLFIVGVKNTAYEFPHASSKPPITLWDAINDLPLLETSSDVCTSYARNPSNTFQKLMRTNSKILNNNEITHHTQKTKNIIKLVPEGNNYKCLPKHLKNTRKVHIAWTRLDGNKPSSTIDTGHRHHFHPKADRVPTVRESARIQSFPDNFKFIGSKTSQYRQVGNAVPPLLAYAIALKLKRILINV